MAREKMFDPAFQKSFTEAIHKENKIRVNWHLQFGTKHRPGFESCAWDDEPDDDDDDFKTGREMLESEPSDDSGKTPDAFARLQQTLKDTPEPEKVRPLAVMKPVPSNVKRFLYKGLSHDGEGRSKYLRTRCKTIPESKFYFPICSSWEYGWTYGLEHELKNPDHGRRQIMKTSFFRPNDPQLKPRD